jgi:hypothetical protein
VKGVHLKMILYICRQVDEFGDSSFLKVKAILILPPSNCLLWNILQLYLVGMTWNSSG